MRPNELVIPESLGWLHSKQYPGLVSGNGLCWPVDDLVYSEHGYPGTNCGATSHPAWYGPAAEFARQLAPLCVWPCTFEVSLFKHEASEMGGAYSRETIEVSSPENPWLAPDCHTWHTKGDGQKQKAEQLARVTRLTGGVIEALAFFARTGQAVLPRWISENHTNRDRWINGKKHKHFYLRIQDLEEQHE